MAHAAQQIELQEHMHAIAELMVRISRLEQVMGEAQPDWSLQPLAQALQALRGVQLIAVMTLVAALQDFVHFANPHRLMSHVGLVPGERSSGAK